MEHITQRLNRLDEHHFCLHISLKSDAPVQQSHMVVVTSRVLNRILRPYINLILVTCREVGRQAQVLVSAFIKTNGANKPKGWAMLRNLRQAEGQTKSTNRNKLDRT